MDDYALGLWVAEQARQAGVEIHEQCGVQAVTTDGTVTLQDGNVRKHDRVLNICGPWAEQLLENSGIRSSYQLDLIRGSHLILGRPCPQAYLLEVPGERRIIFVLPWKGKTLVGTTDLPAGSTVTLTVTDAAGQQQTFSASVQAGGTYSVDVPSALAEGGYTVVAKAADAAGNPVSAHDSGVLDRLSTQSDTA